MPPGGLPEAFLEGGPDSLRQLVLRFAKGRGPFTTARGRRALRPRRSTASCTSSSAPTCSSAASSGPAGASASGAIRTCCAASAAPRSPRCAARSSRPSRRRFGRFLPAWHGIDRRAGAARGARAAAGARAAGLALGERGAAAPRPGLPARVARRALRRRRARLGRRGARSRRRLLPRGRAAARAAGRARRRPRARRPTRSGAALGRSAEFWQPLVETGLEAEAALPALWELVWAGEVTNDAWTPLRAGRRYQAPSASVRPPAPLLAHAAAPRSPRRRAAGRRPSGSSPAAPDRRALAELLLERQGIVTRDGVRGEGIPGGYGAVYGELKDLETIGACRRGYFVEGLGGAQFALAGRGRAAARAARPGRASPSRSCSRPPTRRSRTARRCRGRGGRVRAPPASPARRSSCSAARRRSSSSAAAGRSCRSASPTRSGCGRRSRRSSRTCAARGGAKRLAVERFDGRPVIETEVMPLLVEAGFLAGPRRAVLRPS